MSIKSNFGEILKKTRAEKGVSLEDVEFFTRITTKNLKALESGDIGYFSCRTYALHFLKLYIEFLGINKGEIFCPPEESPQDNRGGGLSAKLFPGFPGGRKRRKERGRRPFFGISLALACFFFMTSSVCFRFSEVLNRGICPQQEIQEAGLSDR